MTRAVSGWACLLHNLGSHTWRQVWHLSRFRVREIFQNVNIGCPREFTLPNSVLQIFIRYSCIILLRYFCCYFVFLQRNWEQKLSALSLCLLLTYSMVQNPSWEANWFAASQEIPRISRNPKIHYHTHKRPPPVSILGQPSPLHIPTSHLLEIRPNIIHPSTPRSPPWSLSLRFPHQDPVHPLSSTICATCPAHPACECLLI